MKKIAKITVISMLAIVIIASVCGLIVLNSWQKSESFVKFDRGKLIDVCATLSVLDKDGQPLREPTYLNNNKQISLSSLPRHVYMAFVCVEDKRFFTHNGIDAKRVAAAFLKNISSGTLKEGASTISQQLIKNTHLTNGKTFSRKINEMLLARQLEQNYSKSEILEMYLNTIYFGRSAFGIENAANVYFNKSASELTVAESATLAGMIKAPNNYAPDKNRQRSTTRRNVVLKLMYEQGAISKNVYEHAKAEELIYLPKTETIAKTYMSGVVNEACKLLNMTENQLYKSGFVIETYCNQTIQTKLTASGNTDKVVDSSGKPTDLSCVVADNDGGICACYLRGADFSTRRQVGSALKPIAVYAPAFNEKIITQASPVLDEETDFNGYKPTNYGKYYGWTTIKTAVTKSLNIPAVKILNALTLEKAGSYLAKFGLDGEQNLSLALGNINGGMTPFELCDCYRTLANGGNFRVGRFIKRIFSNEGEIYADKTDEKRVFDEGASYLVTDLLREATKNGTAKKMKNLPFDIACKTGTVGNKDGNTSAIAAGYTAEHSFVVWYGGKLSNKMVGGTISCEFANSFLSQVYCETKPSNFKKPADIMYANVDIASLNEHQRIVLCEQGEVFAFDKSNMPFAYML